MDFQDELRSILNMVYDVDKKCSYTWTDLECDHKKGAVNVYSNTENHDTIKQWFKQAGGKVISIRYVRQHGCWRVTFKPREAVEA